RAHGDPPRRAPARTRDEARAQRPLGCQPDVRTRPKARTRGAGGLIARRLPCPACLDLRRRPPGAPGTIRRAPDEMNLSPFDVARPTPIRGRTRFRETPLRAPPPTLTPFVPTLRVGMPSSTLRVGFSAGRSPRDAERPGRRSHAKRGN